MVHPAPSFSLQRTLAVRFSLTLLAGLLGLTLWGYLGLRDTLMQQRARSLEGATITIRDTAGRILTSTTMEKVPRDASATDAPAGRSVDLAAPAGGLPQAAVVQVTTSVVPIQQSLDRILLKMVLTVLVVSLATAVGAGWLAKSAVAPVHEITAQAKAITGEVAGQRITAHAEVSEFRGLIEVLNAMVVRLERASQWHRRIIRDLGHDLRTPVTAMRAGVEVALWGERSPAEYRRILASTQEEIDRLALICDALVLLGRLQAGEVKLDLEELDARVLAREAVAVAEEGSCRHQLELEVPADPVLIMADARLMRMVLEQLLDNARRYTPPGSRVEVSVHNTRGGALITVEDNGPGLADDVLQHLFEPFYRSDTARAREGGPGLGLTATASIITLHGGSVDASRGPRGGVRVTLTLPQSKRPAGQGTHSARAMAPAAV